MSVERWSIEVEFDPTLWKPERAREAMEEATRALTVDTENGVYVRLAKKHGEAPLRWWDPQQHAGAVEALREVAALTVADPIHREYPSIKRLQKIAADALDVIEGQ